MPDSSETKKFSRKLLDAAMRKVYKTYRHRPNFTGADVGYRWDGDEKTDQQVVRVHVTAKLPIAEISDTEVFPPDIDGIPLDVIEGPYKARGASAGEPRNKVPVLMGGVSVGRLDNTAGTLGAIVIDERTGRPAALSNWHVLAGPNGQRGDAVIQPGRYDGGIAQDTVGRLSRWMLDIDGDAAVAELDDVRPWLPIQISSFDAFKGHRKSRLNEVLVKQGRSTNKTSARVDGEGIYRVMYEVQPGHWEARDIEGFKLVPEQDDNADNIEISESGDSGATWYNANDKHAVGLHFAGENDSDPRAERAIACNMSQVLSRLGVRLATYDDIIEMAEAANQPREPKLPLVTTPARSKQQMATGWPWPEQQSPTSFPPSRRMRPGPETSRHRVDRMFDDPRDAYYDRLSDVPARGVLRAEQISVSVYLDTWERLKKSLIRMNFHVFHDLHDGDLIEDKINSPYWHNEIARAVRDGRYFDNVLPDFPWPRDYLPCVTFEHVANVLVDHRA